jgi:hypothetical protein
MAQRPKNGAEVFGEIRIWCRRIMEKIKWSEKVTNEEVLEHIRAKRKLLNKILPKKGNWIGHILSRNCLRYDAIKGHMTGVRGIGRKRTHLIHDSRN